MELPSVVDDASELALVVGLIVGDADWACMAGIDVRDFPVG